MTSAVSPFQDLLDRINPWTPISPDSASFIDGMDEVMSRALALRRLEIPVGDFVTSATQKDLPIDVIGLELLKINIADEEVHDLESRRHSQ